MVELTREKLSSIMACTDNIRNVSVIGHLGHGKSTLTRLMKTTAGSFSPICDVRKRFTTLKGEEEHDITVMSTGSYIHYKMTDKDYLVTLIDSPGHVDFSSEVTAALRVTDGALIVVDCYDGVCLNTETGIRQALGETIKPVLAINKIDKCFLEQRDGEEVYGILNNVINNANAIMDGYKDPLHGDVMLDPYKDTVAFLSSKHGWGFRLSDFVSMFARDKSNRCKSKLMTRLWGDHFYDLTTNEWTEVHTSSCERGFVRLCYNPIKNVIRSCLEDDIDQVETLLRKYDVTLEHNDRELKGEMLMNRVMQKWLPSTSLLEMMIFQLPSPPCAQKKRVKNLYEGPPKDAYAKAIENCDPKGPLMIYVSKMIPSSDKGVFFAFGRVFAGKLSQGLKVSIMGPNYISGKTQVLPEADIRMENVDNVQCGNIVALHGLDKFITKNATLTYHNPSLAYPIRAMKFYVSPVLRVNVTCKSFHKLAEGLKLLKKSDLMVVCTTNTEGKGFIDVVGESHLKNCERYLRDNIGDTEISVSDTVVSYCETVLQEPSGQVKLMAPNKLHIYMRASPLRQEGVCCFDPETGSRVDFEYGNLLAKNFRGYVKEGFTLGSQKGVLAEENMRGICFKFELHGDVLDGNVILRDSQDITSAAERVIRASQLDAKPRLLEPVYLAEVLVAKQKKGAAYKMFNQKRVRVIEEYHVPGTPFCHIKAFVPVVTSIGLSRALKTCEASSQFVIDHWSMVEEDEAKIVGEIRAFKGLEK